MSSPACAPGSIICAGGEGGSCEKEVRRNDHGTLRRTDQRRVPPKCSTFRAGNRPGSARGQLTVRMRLMVQEMMPRKITPSASARTGSSVLLPVITSGCAIVTPTSCSQNRAFAQMVSASPRDHAGGDAEQGHQGEVGKADASWTAADLTAMGGLRLPKFGCGPTCAGRCGGVVDGAGRSGGSTRLNQAARLAHAGRNWARACSDWHCPPAGPSGDFRQGPEIPVAITGRGGRRSRQN
jgi:hypothetical protein